MYATLSIPLLLLPISVFGEGRFTYNINDTEFGPNNWANLAIEHNECGGSRQSGIDISTAPCDMTATYTFTAGTCTPSDLIFTINDHVVKVAFDTSISQCTPPSMIIPTFNTTWDVVQYHIHAGTDHTFDGHHFGADMHIVHKNRNGDDLSVLGMFLAGSSDADTGLFDVLIAGLEDVAASTTKACTNATNSTATQGAHTHRALTARSLQDDVYDPYTKVPVNATIYNYPGSLTTPPCSEIVTWNVVDVPISISMDELDSIIRLIADYVDPETCEEASVISPQGYTARPTQPLNGRTITHFCPVATGTFTFAGPPATAPTSSSSVASVVPFVMTSVVFTVLASIIMM